jgi:glutamyl-tRNA reductase
MAANAPVLFLIGANHRTASVELREKLHIPSEQLMVALPKIKEDFGFLELAALSTCNRFELFGTARDGTNMTTLLIDAFIELHKYGGTMQSFDENQVRQSLYMHIHEHAVKHVFKVASSLDSLVLGETQITGQFKDAITLASETNTIGPVLNRLSQDALATAKKVRTSTDIGKKHVSISHAAIELAKKVFGKLGEHKFLLIGAGEMAQVAAKYIKSYSPKDIWVANRTVEKAQSLIDELGGGPDMAAWPLDDLANLIGQVDIVISSTAAPGTVITREMVKRAQGVRKGRPLLLIDIALPRDIDKACADIDDVYVFDIDDLQQVVDANYEERRKAAQEAGVIVDRSTEQFRAWEKTLSVKPALAQFRAFVDGVIEKEKGRTLTRDIFRDLSDKQKEAISAMLEAIGGKISGEASRRILSPPDGYYPELLADVLSILFDQNDKPKDQ